HQAAHPGTKGALLRLAADLALQIDAPIDPRRLADAAAGVLFDDALVVLDGAGAGDGEGAGGLVVLLWRQRQGAVDLDAAADAVLVAGGECFPQGEGSLGGGGGADGQGQGGNQKASGGHVGGSRRGLVQSERRRAADELLCPILDPESRELRCSAPPRSSF